MKTIILVEHGAKKKISNMLNVSLPTIRKALRGEYSESNSEERDLAMKIRKCAINLGGAEVTPTNK